MKTENAFPETLSDLYNHPDFVPFGSSSDDWINDEDRMSRCHDAAENGADGSTHLEIISDWREFIERLASEARRDVESQDKEESEIESDLETLEATIESLDAEIDACETWHDEHGSLHSEVG